MKIIKPNYSTAVRSLVVGGFSGPSHGSIADYVFSDGQTPPSESEIQTELSRLLAEYDANQYQRDRRYPSIGNQLDLLFHDMTAGKGSKTGEWYKAVAKVKADNPKG